eukprot:gene2557-biopygen702
MVGNQPPHPSGERLPERYGCGVERRFFSADSAATSPELSKSMTPAFRSSVVNGVVIVPDAGANPEFAHSGLSGRSAFDAWAASRSAGCGTYVRCSPNYHLVPSF